MSSRNILFRESAVFIVQFRHRNDERSCPPYPFGRKTNWKFNNAEIFSTNRKIKPPLFIRKRDAKIFESIRNESWPEKFSLLRELSFRARWRFSSFFFLLGRVSLKFAQAEGTVILARILLVQTWYISGQRFFLYISKPFVFNFKLPNKIYNEILLKNSIYCLDILFHR